MKTKPMTIILISLTLLLSWSCGNENDNREQKESANAVEVSDTSGQTPAFNFRYDLMTPDLTLDMPDELEEISALSPSADGKQIIALEDETGTLFFLNKSNGKIEKQLEFWKDGDYEGVEAVGEDIYAVKSSGTIYRIRGKRKEDMKVEKFNGHLLGAENDVEGLGYDPVRKRLLLACKGQAGPAAGAYKKAIYGFDLQRMELDSTPAYVISLDEVQAYLKVRPAIRKIEKLIEHFSTSDSAFIFGPSGIAVHPETGHLYILSSVGKLLMVLDPSGAILHIEKLDKDVHIQPEGICFDPDGTMYIANEGRKNEAVIHRFRYQAN